MLSYLDHRGLLRDHHRGSVADGVWVSFMDWMLVNGRPAELMAGNHRMEALKEHLKQLKSADDERWWICDIYDQGR
jgi:hypothetical protein